MDPEASIAKMISASPLHPWKKKTEVSQKILTVCDSECLLQPLMYQ